MDNEIHWHYTIQAYDEFRESDQGLVGVVEITILEADSEEEALEMAKKQIKRPLYRLWRAYQCNDCKRRDLAQEMQMMQLKLLSKHLKG